MKKTLYLLILQLLILLEGFSQSIIIRKSTIKVN